MPNFDFGLKDAIDSIIKKIDENYYYPNRIIKNNNAMIVFWADGTKTIVKRASDELDSDYAAFTAALGRKIFGSNSALKRVVERTETQKPKKQKEKMTDESRRIDG